LPQESDVALGDGAGRDSVAVMTSVDDGLVTLRLDDGKLNVLDPGTVAEFRVAVTAASSSAGLIITGTPGVFTAGLDTKALAAMSPDKRAVFFVEFGELILSLWTTPVPVVCAATGHAIAAGTLLAAAADHVVAARGDFRWGMTEARIGLELSEYAIMLVRSRVQPPHADKLLLEGQVLSPDRAVQLGLADEALEPDLVMERAVVVARELAALPADVFARNKARLRLAKARAAAANLRTDIERFASAPRPDVRVHV
jgi:enoyl-CoA hydratase/carnithine racemase